MSDPTIGSLCFGVGGIELGLSDAVGAESVWYAESDEDAAYVAGKRFVGVPNYGDITQLDWSALPRVDILASGFPCQPISVIGKKRASADDRWLWPSVLAGIRELTPGQVFLENVHNIVSVEGGAILRGILTDLRSAGYYARWTVLGACAIGAPHHRHRWFLLADYVGYRAGEARRIGTKARCGAPRDSGRQLLPTPRASDGMPLNAAVSPEHWPTYADAVSTWERVTGTPVPSSISRSPRGGWQLGPYLPEWMMGLPQGWITDYMPRAASLRLAGNGVVPRAASAAYQLLV